MRIKDVIPTNEDMATSVVAAPEIAISDEDTAKILAVKESDFSAPMTSEELISRMKQLVGNA